MDNLGNNRKTKDDDKKNLSLTDKRFGKHDFEAVLFAIGIFSLIAYLIFFGTVNDAIGNFIGKTLWSMKPNSVANFEKSIRINVHEKICSISGDTSHVSNTFFSYTKNKIFIYDSLKMTNVVNTVDIPGEIVRVHCYYNHEFRSNEYMKKDSEIIKPFSGMFVYCEYMLNKTIHLMCMIIGRNDYDRYDHVKFYKDYYGPDEENIKSHYIESMKSITDNFDKEHATELMNNYVEMYNTWIHPAKTIRKLYDVDIGNSHFLSFSYWKNSISSIIVSKPNGIVSMLDDKGKVTSKLTFPNIVWCHPIPGELAYCLLFDGSRLTNFNVMNNALEVNKSIPVTLNAGAENYQLFINDEPANETFTSEYILSNGGYLEKINFWDLNRSKLGIETEPVSFGNIYYTDDLGKTVVYSLIDENKVSTRYKMIHYEGFPSDNKQISAYRYAFQRLYIALTSDQLNENLIIIVSCPDLFAVSTSGIDEPVDEAHVTYEDGRLTIYFMNKTSIYRWQNSQEGISNLKLRKLDIKPEPID